MIVNGAARVSRAAEPVLEIEMNGEYAIAFLDETGSMWGGRLDGTPLLRFSADGPLRSPHIAALKRRTSFAAFDRRGFLAHWGGK